ncbi:MAG: CBS domain-containing protein [Syntrophobacteraceae bacterium]
MKRVKELMTGVSEIPVVEENATLFEVVLEIGGARAKRPAGAPYPALLVVDKDKRFAGFLELGKMLLALDPGYGELAESAREKGVPFDAIRSELQRFGPLEDALEDLCKKAADISIKSVMSIPGPDRITGGEVSISEAAYRMAVSGVDYLFVLEGTLLEGIISLSDVMGHICETVRACRL